MGLSIITPHYNELPGLKRIFSSLQAQTHSDWEWLIVDDFSDETTVAAAKGWYQVLGDDRIQFIFNTEKTNASVCRNLGAELSKYDTLVFLDADDAISENFVLNRLIEFDEFAIFKNWAVVNSSGNQTLKTIGDEGFLDSFLKARFIWQTTAVLWKKPFFQKVGKFDPNLERLQDVELSIRGLILSNNFRILDNEVDFFYCSKPIRSKEDIVRKSCASVNYLISKLDDHYDLDKGQRELIKAYYYACVKVLQRTKDRGNIIYVKESLELFKKKKYISSRVYFMGHALLYFYRYRLISDRLFLNANRYLFK